MFGKRQFLESQAPAALIAEMAAVSARSVAPEFDVFTEALQRRFGDVLCAVLLYGSAMRANDPTEGVLDLYALVDDYRRAYAGRWLRFLNAALPPNVFYEEAPVGATTARAKYAVVSLSDFERGIRSGFHPYFWARFCQETRLIWAKDIQTSERVHALLAAAVVRFLGETLAALESQRADAGLLWTLGFRLTYAAELRPEREDRALGLVRASVSGCRRLTELAAPALGDRLEMLPGGDLRVHNRPQDRRRALRRWRLRRWQGRCLSLLRLAKAVFTFRNSVEYAAWKVERHTGVRIPVTPRLRRHPLLYGSMIVWQLFRRGALR